MPVESRAGDLDGSSVVDRHRVHRALRDLLSRLAAARALVLCLDDVHWADPASADALAALVRRPPATGVLLVLAAREGQLPVALGRALAAAMSEDRAARIELGPLSSAEAGELLGADPGAIFSLSGGNPFYLQQLARAHVRGVDGGVPGEGTVPAAVAASLASELGELSPRTRLLFEAAGVVGDPFEPDLAAEVAEVSETVALQALDELLARGLARPAGAPRRFAFRHPLVRHAVYAAAAGGWRLARSRGRRAGPPRGGCDGRRASPLGLRPRGRRGGDCGPDRGGGRCTRVGAGERGALLRGGVASDAGRIRRRQAARADAGGARGCAVGGRGPRGGARDIA